MDKILSLDEYNHQSSKKSCQIYSQKRSIKMLGNDILFIKKWKNYEKYLNFMLIFLARVESPLHINKLF